MLLYLILFLIGILALIMKGSRKRKFANQIGGPYTSGYPLIGNTLDFLNNLDKTLLTLNDWSDKYGERFAFSIGPSVIFATTNVKDMEKILTSNSIIDKSEDYELVRDWLGEGLITSTGSHWSYRRKLINPTFHFSILERFIGPICSHASILVEILKENFVNSTDGFKDIGPFIAHCALDIICETAMGKQLNAQRQSQGQGSNEYVDAVHRMGKLFQYRTVRPWLRTKFLWNLTSARKEELESLNTIHSFTDKVIQDRKKFLKSLERDDAVGNTAEKNDGEDSGKTKHALLDLLLSAKESGSQISDAGLREECTTFIFAGHDTVSVAVSLCLVNIGCHPDVQEKVHQELDAIFEGDANREITMTIIREMKYLECCIKESLRLFPSVPILGRETKCDFKLDESTIIPRGIAVYVIPYILHRNPTYFPQPNEYIPERFEQGNSLQNKNTFAYIPFSAGPRNCIGQKLAMIEAKIMLASILRKFKVKSERIEKEDLLSEIVLRCKGGMKVQLMER